MTKSYYVSAANGNDKNAGTEKKPLKTIQAGVNKLSAGDTLLVRNGVYKERVIINRSGDSQNPISIQAYPNEKPIIDGSNIKLKNTLALVSIVRCRHVVFAGFTVQDSQGRGIYANQGQNLLIDNCHVQYCVTNGIIAIDTHDSTIQNCKVRACAQQYVSAAPRTVTVALLLSRCNGVTLKNNQCYENPADGIALFSCRSCVVRQNTSYDNRESQIKLSSVLESVVDSNFCYHTGRQAYLHLSGGRPPGIAKSDRSPYRESGFWHTRNITIINNIVVGCASGFECPSNGGALTAVELIHNTFVNNTDTAFRIDSQQAHRASVFENNLVANTNGGAMASVTRQTGLLWRHNFWSKYPSDDTYNPANDIVNPNTGLRDINAPVAAGTATTAPYELTAVSPAVNVGIRSEVAIDFYGRTRDVKPDIGAHEFDNTNGTGPDEAELPPSGQRVKAGLQVLYDFSAGWGNKVADVSGEGAPLDLTIQNTAAVQWANQGLIIKTPTTIGSSVPATKVINACKASNEITIEAWITPATTEQGGPSRIVSVSGDTNNRNMTLAQGLKNGEPTDLYNVRLRTTDSNENGIPSISSAAGSLMAELTHVVFTRDKTGKSTIYMNGQERAIGNLSGSFSNWESSYRFLLANEKTGDRPWLGTYTLVAVFSRALRSQEVQHNYNAGLPELDPLVAEFSIGASQEIGVSPHAVDFSSADSYSVNGITGYAWDFGDGGKSTEANPSHTYDQPGVYSVSLTITDQTGLTSSATKANLITVTDSVLPALPPEYARFILANIVESRVLAFGIQYPDGRCMLAWNEDPYQIMIYRELDDVVGLYRVPGTVEMVWIDNPAAEPEDTEPV